MSCACDSELGGAAMNGEEWERVMGEEWPEDEEGGGAGAGK